MKLNNALGFILQYITDLLPPELPPNWWSISKKNHSYAYRMKNIVGVEDILTLAGYTKKTRDFLSFPEGDKKRPDRELLAQLATEILLAREECSAAADGRINLRIDEEQMEGPPLDTAAVPMLPVGVNPRTDVHYMRPMQNQYENVASHRHTSYQPPVGAPLTSRRLDESIGFSFHNQSPPTSTAGPHTQQVPQFDPISSATPTTPGVHPVPKPRTRSFKGRSDSNRYCIYYIQLGGSCYCITIL